MVRIAQVQSGTIAEELDLEIGTRVVRINGAPVRDTIDLRFLEVDESLELELAAPGSAESVVYEIEKPAGEPLGIVTAPDPVRQCANRCAFCFIDGNPPDARESLFLKDDDFRLSFSYGSYVTLTNLGPRGFERIIEQRLSPLYVSVHATEPEIREAALGVPRGGDILERLEQLLGAGIEVHTQVVLCPGLNDGAHLERTMDDLFALGEGVLSLSIVPVGLTRYNLGRPIRLLTKEDAVHTIQQIEAMRARVLEERGIGWVYAADEMFFIAGMPLPEPRYYDDWPLTENGVGAVRQLLDDFEINLLKAPRLDGQRIAVVTGRRMAPVIAPLLPRLAGATGSATRLVEVGNQYFGDTVTTAGLLPGLDIVAALQLEASRHPFDLVLLPAEALNDDERFIDDIPLDAVARAFPRAVLRPAHELVTGLRSS
jgi:putative radical SAM enzyme (TIGR03279 family)